MLLRFKTLGQRGRNGRGTTPRIRRPRRRSFKTAWAGGTRAPTHTWTNASGGLNCPPGSFSLASSLSSFSASSFALVPTSLCAPTAARAPARPCTGVRDEATGSIFCLLILCLTSNLRHSLSHPPLPPPSILPRLLSIFSLSLSLCARYISAFKFSDMTNSVFMTMFDDECQKLLVCAPTHPHTHPHTHTHRA